MSLHFLTISLILAFSSLLLADGEDCSFEALLGESAPEVARYFAVSSPRVRRRRFDAADPSTQSGIIDMIAMQRLEKWGTYGEVILLQEMYDLALSAKADRAASLQALGHLTQVFSSEMDPVYFQSLKIEHRPTGSGFKTGQSNADFSRAKAIELASHLAAQGVGTEYHALLLLSGLKEAFRGSANRPRGDAIEKQAAANAIRLLLSDDSKFPEQFRIHLKQLLAN